MRRFLHNFPLHTFLFVFFVSFFLYAQNVALVDLSMLKRTLFYGMLVCCFFFFTFYLFYRNRIKAGIASTMVLLVLFNYGVMYDGLEYIYYAGLWPFTNIHRYLLAFTIVLCGLVVWFVHKKLDKGMIINYFLNWLVILLLLFNLFKIVFFAPASENKTARADEKTTLVDDVKPLPNIYYIILDGYANQHVLQKYYHFDNSAFLGFLEQNGFYIADSSCANYFSTMSSLSSTFNLDYHSVISGDLRRNQLRNNRWFHELKRRGYTLYNMESGYSVTSRFSQMDSTIEISSPNEFERSILKFTIFRLDEIFGIIQHRRLESQIEKLDEIAEIAGDKKFVFIHLVAPHPPFVFNSKGERVFNMKNHDNSWEPKENYINQLIYVNSVMEKFIRGVTQADKQAMIIIQSDHGPWIVDPDKEARFEARAMILNAMRLPGANQNKLYRGISSVNTFRFVMKNYFDSTFTMLPDLKSGKNEIMESIFFTKKN